MAYEYTMVHRVEFAETDMAGIMHFANFFRFMERTEHAFFRSLGLSIHAKQADPAVGWPRVHASCDYRMPLRFEDEVEVHLRVREKRSKSLTYDFVFRNLSAEGAPEAAHGTLTAVCVAMDPEKGRMKAMSIPPWIWEQIEAVPSIAPPAETGAGVAE
jgi:acyl-CoA thioester hydrolase